MDTYNDTYSERYGAAAAGTKLLQTEVETLCRAAGFGPLDAKIMAAISMVEAPFSNAGKAYSDFGLIGDQALANTTWGYSYGGFQIRSLRADAGTGRFRDAQRLPEPAFSAQSALTIWREHGFTPWSTFMTGQYKALMQDLYPPQPGMYVVIPGDSLSAIAAKLKAGTWEDLARVNGLRSPFTIFIGQTLFLPWFSYTVRSRDSLSRIVVTYGHGVTYQTVAAFNGLTAPYVIRPGQIIRIPRSTL